MDSSHAIGYVLGLLAVNALPLFAGTLLIRVGRRGLAPILTATVIGALVSWVCMFIMGGSSIAGLVGLFALAGVYSEVLDVPFGRAVGLAIVVGFCQIMMFIVLHHGAAAQAQAAFLATRNLPLS